MSTPDDNDRLRRGELPQSPLADAHPYEPEGESPDRADGNSVNCVNSVPGGDWEAPLPLAADQPDLPEFPIDTLPPVIADFALALAEQAQVPSETSSCCVIGVVSAAIAGTHVVEPWPGWREPTNSWMAPFADPGTRKSTVIREATAPVKESEARLDQNDQARRARLSARNKVTKKRLDQLLRRSAEAPDDPELLAELQSLTEEAARLSAPVAPRLFTTNATPESIPLLLAAQGGRLLVVSAEGGEIVAIAAGLYSRGQDNFDVLLKGWSGDQILVDRKNSEPVRVDDPALSMILMFQRSVLAQLGCHKTFRGRGLLARFLFCIARDLVGHRKPQPRPIPDEVRKTYARLIGHLFRIEQERELQDDDVEWATGPESPHVITFDEGAQEAMREFFSEMEEAQRPGGPLYGMRDWASKAHGQAARITAAIHAALHGDMCCPADVTVDRQTVENAVRITRFFLAHARAAFALMGETIEVAQALRILDYLRRERTTSISRRDLHRALQSEFESAKALDDPLALLEHRQHVRISESERQSGRRGRKPSPLIEVNPHLYDRNDTNDRRGTSR